jgi:glycosyltransferase involved in cell wall biosynthesis
MHKPKILFLSADDPLDRKSWSGIQYKMFQELSGYFEVIPSGPIPANWKIILIKIFARIGRLVFGKNYNTNHSKIIGKSHIRQIAPLLQRQYDAIFASTASRELSQLTTDIPVVMSADGTFDLGKDYYPVFSNLFSFSSKESDAVEQAAIDKADEIIYSSEWAATSAIEKYKANKAKVHVVQYGANIDAIDNKPKPQWHNQCFNILFLAAEWERKGGPIVYETYLLIKEAGYHVKLTICGCKPHLQQKDGIEIIPFLNKNEKKDLDSFTELMHHSHILFIPTRADCTPIAFSEAAGFGIPVITTDTGGISSIVKNGVNGYCLAYDATPAQYAEAIINIIQNENLYNTLSVNNRRMYEEKLNWQKWGLAVKEIIESKIESKNKAADYASTYSNV